MGTLGVRPLPGSEQEILTFSGDEKGARGVAYMAVRGEKSLTLVMGTTQNRSPRRCSRHSWRPLLCLALSWALEALRKKAQQGGDGEPLQSGVITAVTGPVLSGCPRKPDGALSAGQGAGKPQRQCGSIEKTPDLTLPPSWCQDSHGQTPQRPVGSPTSSNKRKG